MGIKKGQSLCFFSAKGGVGKTTNIINLAGVLEQLDKKVLIIDLDLYGGGVATFLNIKTKKNIFDIADDMYNSRYTELKDYVSNYDDCIDIIGAPIDPRDANKITPNIVEKVIQESRFNYDIVLIDTNQSLNEINLMTLSIVDKILFLVTNDPLDLKNLKSLLTILKKLEMKNYKVLLNNSRDPFKNYFSMYDIKKVLKTNIDYTLSNQIFDKDIDKNIMSGKITTLENSFFKKFPEDYQSYLAIATDALEVVDYE